jgi:hypothetical protein
MTQTTTRPITCAPATRVTKSLLGYGVIAGPVYVAVSLGQALTRDGFDLRRHPWSMLSNGSLGWLQITNFVLTGLMVVAFAVGLRRALTPGSMSSGLRSEATREDDILEAPGSAPAEAGAGVTAPGPGATWAPRLIAAYGVGLVAAGAFRADPAWGFPAGTPDGPGEVSWHGMLHVVAGGIGFSCLIAACFVLAHRFTAEDRRGWAAYSRVTGVVFLAGFLGIASGGGSPATTLAFVAAVLVAWTWVSAVAAHRYRATA